LLTRGIAVVQSGENVVLASLKKFDCESCNTVIGEMIDEMIDPDQHQTFASKLILKLLLFEHLRLRQSPRLRGEWHLRKNSARQRRKRAAVARHELSFPG
jgi:hypothetical protein